jgi:hypothetical protein
MLWTICLIFMVLWILGYATAHTFGGLLHLLLLVAVISAIAQIVTGRRGEL